MSRRAVPRLAPRPARADFVVVTGLSGAGKSQALNALEDLGYYCVDNLPVTLLPDLFAAASPRGQRHAEDRAWSSTCASGASSATSPAPSARLRESSDVQPSLIFLEASDDALVRRFSETRRPHPLAPDQPVADAVAPRAARSWRASAALADEIVDTSRPDRPRAAPGVPGPVARSPPAGARWW